MGAYRLEGPKPARMYEVILPKKLGYYGKIEEVLEDLFDEAAIRSVPYVRRLIADARRRDPAFDEAAWIRTLCQASRGYSIYEMDGRYLSAQGPIDERVLVFRFIFHNPTDRVRPRVPTSSPPRWRSSTSSSPTASPRSWASRRRSGSSNTPSPAWPSGARPTSLAPPTPTPILPRSPAVDHRRTDRPLCRRRHPARLRRHQPDSRAPRPPTPAPAPGASPSWSSTCSTATSSAPTASSASSPRRTPRSRPTTRTPGSPGSATTRSPSPRPSASSSPTAAGSPASSAPCPTPTSPAPASTPRPAASPSPSWSASYVGHLDHHLKFLYAKRGNIGMAIYPRYSYALE